MMQGIQIVALKELRDSLRDRRTLLNSLVMGPVLAPLLFIGLLTFAINKETEKAEEILHLPVVNQTLAPNLVSFLEQQDVVIEDPPANPEQAILDEEHDVVVRITEDYPEQWRDGRPAVVEVIADESRSDANTTVRRVRLLLNGYGTQIGSLRLQLRGVNPQLMQAVRVKDVDLSTPKSRGAQILSILPYFIMITLFVSCMPVAIDTTAGEKERQSLEPLLLNPLPRWQFMLGKLAATAAFGLISLALFLIMFVLMKGLFPASNLGFELNLDWAIAAKIWYSTAPIAVVAATILVTLAAFAKSFREAQSYLGMVILIPMLPTLWLALNPVKAETWMMSVPLLSQNVLITELVRGENVPATWGIISIVSTLALGFVLAIVAAKLYERPKLIFSS